MRWFEGGIPAAIQASKANKSLFVVFIAGEDAKTVEMEACLHSEEVTSLCEANNSVAIKLSGASNDCKFFSRIYPVVVIPSTFFIGDNGVPLEVAGEVKSQADFMEKVTKAVELQKSMSAQVPADSQGAVGGVGATSNVGSSEGASQAGQLGEAGSGDESGARPTASADTGEAIEDRVERAKNLVELKRQEKMRQEKEEARRKEQERRNLGQGVQKLREHQKEMELREARKEFKKDKEEDRIARQRVKEEIERDRAEKAQRFNREKDERARAADEARKKKLAEQQAVLDQERAQRSDTARIQFRMADGSFLNQQFPATDAFDSVRQFITQHVGSEVSLSTLFPRRTFTEEDAAKTLQELQLAPSAAILVIQGRQATGGVRSSTDSSLSLSGLTGLVLSPLVFIWNLLSSLLGLSGGASSSSSSGNSGNSGNSSAGAAEARAESATGGDRDRGSAQKRPAPAGSRQEGAIRRFRNAEDDEDDEDTSTWNGNSTQQM